MGVALLAVRSIPTQVVLQSPFHSTLPFFFLASHFLPIWTQSICEVTNPTNCNVAIPSSCGGIQTTRGGCESFFFSRSPQGFCHFLFALYSFSFSFFFFFFFLAKPQQSRGKSKVSLNKTQSTTSRKTKRNQQLHVKQNKKMIQNMVELFFFEVTSKQDTKISIFQSGLTQAREKEVEGAGCK